MSANKACYYETLGVSKNSDGKTLKSAYRKLAMQYHPDRNPNNAEAEQQFKTVSEAYGVLSDQQKRAAYDRFGHAGMDGARAGGGGFAGAQGADFSDIFEQVFGDAFGDVFGGGGQRSPSGPARGSDLRYPLEIELEDAFLGKEIDIKIPTTKTCNECDGKGAEPGTEVETCSTCQGHGRVRVRQGFFTMEQHCRDCGGQGTLVKSPCKACDGVGAQATRRELSVTIPAGVEDGTRIRLSGEGAAGTRGGPAGDLYIFISVRPHALFERDGADLYCRAPTPMAVAALGGEIEMPTIDGGRKRVNISAGVQTGKRLRLRGAGMSRLRRSNRGDMIVEIFVETPRNLNAKQKELLEEFREQCCPDSHPEHASFFEKARGFWDKVTGE
ncbi:Chaperone protein DnaJ [hydrothermal vent metagenome]|uniref:Chaperone protein DnaJ n=1 Tax=hydrothermal vent metagenome TaxID=652676 RepID=A0A3B0SHU6_9ZZZZ